MMRTAPNIRSKKQELRIKGRKLLFRVAVVFFLTSYFLILNSKSVNAQVLSLNPQTAQVTVGDEFTVDINIDTQGTAVAGADVKLTFDPNVLEVTNVQAGDFFGDEADNVGSGTLYVAGFFKEQFATKTGTGRVAQLTLKGKQEGTSTFTFVCSTQTNDCNILDASATDIIKCTTIQNGSYTFSGAAAPTATPTVQGPTATPPTAGFSAPTFFSLGLGVLLTIVGLAIIL